MKPRRESSSSTSTGRVHAWSAVGGRPSFLLAFATVFAGACASNATIARGVVTRTSVDSASAAALQRERGANTTSRSTLGVTPFRIVGGDARLTSLGFALADLLVTDLSSSSQLQLVERARLGEVLRELDLGRSTRMDSSTAPRVGQLLRARRLVLGSLDTLPSGELRVSARIADVETGVLEQALDARAPFSDVLAAEKAVAFRLFDALGVSLTPAERTRIESRQVASLSSLDAYGRGVQAELQGDRRRAVDEFERAFRIDPGFGAANDRAAQLKITASGSVNAPTLLPGVRQINAPEAGTVDRLNRPLDFVTSLTRPSGGTSDPSFPSTVVTVVVTVRRP
jgi:TolB-like protein